MPGNVSSAANCVSECGGMFSYTYEYVFWWQQIMRQPAARQSATYLELSALSRSIRLQRLLHLLIASHSVCDKHLRSLFLAFIYCPFRLCALVFVLCPVAHLFIVVWWCASLFFFCGFFCFCCFCLQWRTAVKEFQFCWLLVIVLRIVPLLQCRTWQAACGMWNW